LFRRTQMRRKRPCRICGRWFLSHPRAGDRQRVCSAAPCQRERHRRACERWRQREAPAERQHRLRQRIRVDPEGEAASMQPLGERLAWDAVRDAVGLEISVIIEEIVRLLEDAVRDAVGGQVRAGAGESRQVLGVERRDDMVGEARTP
jgi:hypothetical protein